ncbi:RidA family protein [Antrihabitans sp. YC2-6]|uniref:RidA family protein n=1 Tax=Antrihabitans sp. YC2-6 TaxID=2799498 RepID=UPI0018F4978E|nr:RidA family protein [Antrihabitans sp. YC2-6]MBJ8346677.1 RidA family protein [Antrihabitans sp. YC2-6]
MTDLNHPYLNATSPVGNFSYARRIGPFTQVSGQLGLSAGATTIAGQTAEALEKVEAILTSAGLSWSDVLTVRVHLASDDLFDDFDAAYAAIVPPPFPARVTVSSGLAPGALVEIDALAVTPNSLNAAIA